MRKAVLAGLLLAAAPISAVVAQNWDATYSATDGGQLQGNPQASTRLTTFVSYTCPHCANFETQAEGPLRLAYVQTGRVAVEVRHVIRNPVDLAAALAGRRTGHHPGAAGSLAHRHHRRTDAGDRLRYRPLPHHGTARIHRRAARPVPQ